MIDFLKLFFQKRKEAFLTFFSFLKKKKSFFFKLVLAFFISDLFILEFHRLLIPKKSLPPLKVASLSKNLSTKNYNKIWQDNVFHVGEIPTKKLSDMTNKDPIKTSLPFSLQGTIVHANPIRSVATVKNKESQAYKVGDVIEKQAKITEIQRRKIIFINQNNNDLEYLDIPENFSLNMNLKNTALSPSPYNTSLIKRQGNSFQVKRSDINEHLENLPKILNQARVVPHREEKGGSFAIEGFRFTSIKKGSVFEKLGFQLGDVIKQVDGELINNPEKALTLFERLKDSSGFKILVQRDGEDVEYDYNVSEDAPIN